MVGGARTWLRSCIANANLRLNPAVFVSGAQPRRPRRSDPVIPVQSDQWWFKSHRRFVTARGLRLSRYVSPNLVFE